MNGIRNLKQVALDSNVFIYHFEGNPHFTSQTNQIFNRLATDRLKAVTSIITLAEILSLPNAQPLTKGITTTFFSTPNVLAIEVTREIAIEAARIRQTYGFLLPDAIQLATAVCQKAQAFITNDTQLVRFKGVKVILLRALA